MKNLGKKKYLILGIIVVLILIIGVFFMLGKKSTNYYSVMSDMLSTKVGDFTYTFDVMTSEYTAEEGETQEVVQEDSSKKDSWNVSSGDTNINWTYPEFIVTLDGRTESVVNAE